MELDFDKSIEDKKPEPKVNILPIKKGDMYRTKMGSNFMIKPSPKLKKYLQIYCDTTGLEPQAVIKTAIFEYCREVTGKIE